MLPNLPCLSGFLAASLLVGCSADYHKKQADKDVYAILQQVENDIFGSSSGFSIDSKNSSASNGNNTAEKILRNRSTGEKMTLNIDQAINYAIKNSREYQSEKEGLYLTALTLTGAQHEFKPKFFGGARPNYTRLSNGDTTGSVDPVFGLNQTFKSGATLGIRIANDLLRYFTGDIRSSAISTISVNIAQPLLRGAGNDIATEQLTQANRNVIYAIRDYTHFQNTFSVNIVTDYFALLQSKQVIFNEYNNYLSRKANSEYLNARVDRELPEAVGNAEQSELQAKNRYISSITSYRNSLDRFKITLGLPQVTELHLDDKEIQRIRKNGAKPLKILNAQAFEIALVHRLPLFNQIDRFEDSNRQVAIAANRLKAELNIVGGASINNNGETTDYNQFNFNDVRASVGLQLNLPLDRLRERNDYRATLIKFEVAIRQLGRDFDELRNLLDRRIRDVEQFRQSYNIQTNAYELAKKRVEGNKLRFQAGTVIFSRLSEAQDDLIAAQNAETRSLVTYLGAKLNLMIDLGILNTDNKSYWLKKAPRELKESQQAPTDNQIPTVDDNNRVVPPTELFQ